MGSLGLAKQEKHHQVWIRDPVSRWWWVGMSMYVSDRALGLSKTIVRQKYAVVVEVVVVVVIVVVGVVSELVK